MGSVPGEAKLSRYIKPRQIDGSSISSEAYELRSERKEKSLSVNWLDLHPGDSEFEKLKDLKENFPLEPHPKGAFAQHICQTVIDHVRSSSKDSRKLAIRRTAAPGTPNDSHCGISGYSYEEDDKIIAVYIAETVAYFELIKNL